MLFRRAAVPLLLVLVTALTTALATTLTMTPAGAQPEPRRLDSVTVTTVGYGHGKGLSQYGAYARAQAGQSWREIVRHYYPTTRWGRAGGTIRVQITADTSRDVVVVARPGLKVAPVARGHAWRLPTSVRGKQVRAWRIQPVGHRSKVSFRTGGWHRWRTLRGDAEFSAGGQPIELVTPEGRVEYRGALRSASVTDSGRDRDTVNVLPIDTYLRGVLSSEVFSTWPADALRAQAVAARTYAAFERRDNRRDPYDLCDTPNCQVYDGVAAETSPTDAAVKKTRHRVVTYQGRPIFAQFSASNGGWSVDGGYPYLIAEEDPYDTGEPEEDPTVTTFSAADITKNWPGMGDLVSITVTSRDGRGPYGGRALELTVVGTLSTQTVSGDDFRDWMGLRSTLLEIT